MSESGSVTAPPAQPGPTWSPGAETSTGATLRQLVNDVGDTAIVQQFVADYLLLLNRRIESLEVQLARPDFEAASISLLTLETSSAMVGGVEVALAARELRRVVDNGQKELVVGLVNRLLGTLTALQHQLVDVELRPQPKPHPVAE